MAEPMGLMALRTDEKQWIIYQPDTVGLVFQAMQAASLVQFGAWLERRAKSLPHQLRDNIGTIGKIMSDIGDARQQINAGLAPNDVPDGLVEAQRGWNRFVLWLRDPKVVPIDEVEDVVDQIAAAMVYLNQRTHETGTNHPRWNSRLVSGQPCKECGR